MPSPEAVRIAKQVFAERGYSKGVDAATQAKASAAAILHKLPSKLTGNGRLQIFRENVLQLRPLAEHLDREQTAKDLNTIAATYIRDPAAVKDIIAQAVTPIVNTEIKAKGRTGNAKPMAAKTTNGNGTGDFPGDRPLVSTPDPTPHKEIIPESADGEPDYEADADVGPNGKNVAAGTPQSAAMLGIWNAGAKALRPPPRGWLLGNQFCRGFLSTIEAAGATGKTAVRTLQMLSMATLKELTGEHVFRRCRVLAISFEDGKEEQERRLLAAQLHHNIAPKDIDGWLYCWTPKGIKLAHLKEGTPARGALEKMLRDVVAELKIDFVSLDPFIKLHSLSENDNGAMDFVTDLLVQIAIDCQVAVDAPHHTKKGLQTAGDADAGRGASARRDAARLGYTLTHMTEEDAKALGIPAGQRKLYIRLDSGKVNIAPPSAEATWFKLVGVQLGNENDEYPSGDNVQTVERWYPPETWAGVTVAQLNAALTDIDAGLPNGQRYSEGNKTAPRSAWPIVQRHCPDRTEAQCREIIKTWVKNGVVVAEDYDDPIERKSRKGLSVCNAKRPT